MTMIMTGERVWAGRRLFFEDIDAYIDSGSGMGVYPDHPRHEVKDPAEANLVSSLADDGPPWIHRPVIDIDHPCEIVPGGEDRFFLRIAKAVRTEYLPLLCKGLYDCGIAAFVESDAPGGEGFPLIHVEVPFKVVPSTTEGHFHWYIDKRVEWFRYDSLLHALVECGIVEKGYYKAACRRGATFVRMPGVRKPGILPTTPGITVGEDPI